MSDGPWSYVPPRYAPSAAGFVGVFVERSNARRPSRARRRLCTVAVAVPRPPVTAERGLLDIADRRGDAWTSAAIQPGGALDVPLAAKNAVLLALSKGRIVPLDGGVYIESSVKYAQFSSGENYKTLNVAWRKIKEELGWKEFSTIQALLLEMPVRALGLGERYGRHVRMSNESYKKLREAASNLRLPNITRTVSVEADTIPIILHRLPLAGQVRSVAARCPNSNEHRDGDRHPSLIMWMNADGVTGGAQCQVCRDKSGTPLRYGVRYDGNVAHLIHLSARLKPMPVATNGAIALGSKPAKDAVKEKTKKVKKSEKKKSGKELPVGGCMKFGELKPDAEQQTYVCAFLKTVVGSDGKQSNFRTAGYAHTGDPLSVLRSSEALSKTDASVDRAMTCAWMTREAALFGEEAEDLLYTPMLSVSCMQVATWRKVGGNDNMYIPMNWNVKSQAWVLFDVDDLELLTEERLPEVITRVNRVISRDIELSGRSAIVHTSTTGLQIWCELREERLTPRRWLGLPETKSWYRALGRRVMKSIRKSGVQNGKVDMCSFAAGRFGRRPGWRILKSGELFRAKLIDVKSTRMPVREPRLDAGS